MTTTTTEPINITPAIDLLDARSYEGGAKWAYEAKEVGEVYLVSRERMEDLTRALADAESIDPVYSLWCSDSRLSDDEHCSLDDVLAGMGGRLGGTGEPADLAAMRSEAAAAGDILTVAAIDLLA